MKTRTAFITILTAIITLTAGSAFGKYSGGSGTTGDPYRIASASDLQALAGDSGDYGKAFILTNDINLAGITINPIGNTTITFTGVFDGDDHIVRNIVINTPGSAYVGLFGWVGPGGQVKNIGVVDANFHSAGNVGGLVGYNEGSITSCYATGVVISAGSAGGLVGYNYSGIITYCYATGSARGGDYVGGLAGLNYGEITFSYATGAAVGNNMVGGLVGDNYSTITSCYSTGAVSGTSDVGGLAGLNYSGTVTACYATGSVSGTSDIGGITGYNFSGTLIDCLWDTNTSGLTGGDGSGSTAGVYGRTTAQMKTLSTFTGLNWDFVGETANGTADIWTMPAGGYPILSWQGAMDASLSFHVTKCSVTAGTKVNSDKIAFSGTMNATAGDFNDANNSSDANFVKVTISDDNMDPCVFTFPVNNKTYKKGKFSSTITSKPLKVSFAFDTKKTKFSFSASSVDLTGLACPVGIEIEVGGRTGTVDVNEAIVNGTKKVIPYQLMMGVRNLLVADKVSFKRGSKPDANSLTVSGRFTTEGEGNLSNPMIITVGSQTFTLPGNQFLSKNGVVSCKNAVANEGPLVRVTAKLDYVKCTFAISVKYASILQSGVVDFGIDCFGVNLVDLETINLGP